MTVFLLTTTLMLAACGSDNDYGTIKDMELTADWHDADGNKVEAAFNQIDNDIVILLIFFVF